MQSQGELGVKKSRLRELLPDYNEIVVATAIIFLILMALAPNINAYQIIGNSVTYSNSWGSITQYPHTLTDVAQYAYLNITSNITGTINIDSAFGFDTDKITPQKAYYWMVNAPHQIPTFGYINELQTVSCGGTSTGVINSTNVWCFYSSNSTNQSLYCPTPRYFPNSMTCQYNLSVYRQTGMETVYYDDWHDISNLFAKKTYAEKTWYIIENVSFSQGQTRQLKILIWSNPNTQAKYDIRMKRSSDSWSDAINNLVPNVYLDPWINTTFGVRQKIDFNSTVGSILTNFTQNVTINHAALVAQGCLANGSDIRILNDSNYVHKFEIDNGNNTASMLMWILIPSYPKGITTPQNYSVYLYCKNSTWVDDGQDPRNTWPSYTDVYHLQTNGISSTWATNLSISQKTPVYQTAYCPFGGCLNTSYGSYMLNITSSHIYYKPGNLTGQCWTWANTSYRDYTALTGTLKTDNTDGNWNLHTAWASENWMFIYGTTSTPGATTPLPKERLTLLTFNINSTSGKGNIWINTTLVWSVTVAAKDVAGGTGTFHLGGFTNWFTGIIDECRYSNTLMNGNSISDWISAEISSTAWQGDIELYSAGGDSITASNVSLTNGTAHTALSTPYTNNPALLTAQGNCTGSGKASTYIGNFTFYRNGTAYSSMLTYNWVNASLNYSNSSIAGTNLKKGESWYVGLICYNSTVNSSQVFSSAITINNSAPTIGAPSISGLQRVTENLTCTNGTFTDPDSDSAGKGYWRWFRNTTVIAGNTTQTVNTTTAGIGATDRVICEWNSEDSSSVGQAYISNSTNGPLNSSAIIIDSLPYLNQTNLTLSTGATISTLYTTSIIRCQAFVWDNENSTIKNVTLDYYINNTFSSSYESYNVANFSMAVSNTTKTNLKKSDTWGCRARANDGLLISTAYVYSATNYTVNNSAPTIGAPSITSNDTLILPSSILTCVNSSYSDADGDPIGIGYWRWFLNDTPIGGATSQDIDIGPIPAGVTDRFRCEYHTEDTSTVGQAYISNSTNQNSSEVVVVAAGTTAALTIVAYDESTGSQIYFNAVIANSTNSSTLTYQSTYSSSISNTPLGSVTITISNSSYYQRIYYTTLTSNVSANVTGYLPPIAATTLSVNFIVQDQASRPVSNALISISRFLNGSWTVTGQKYTDSSGVGQFYMDSLNQYQISVTATGYNTFSSTITPTSTSYIITLSTTTTGLGFPNRIEGTSWGLSPNAPWKQNETIASVLTVSNNNCSLTWFSYKLLNGTTQLYFSNDTTHPCGTALSYSFIPGINANLSALIEWQLTNRSPYSQTVYIASFMPVNFSYPGPNEIKQALQGTNPAFSPFAWTLIFLVIGVMVAGFVGQLSPTFGVMSFLIIMGIGFWFSFGLLGAGSVLLVLIVVSIAYYAMRGNG